MAKRLDKIMEKFGFNQEMIVIGDELQDELRKKVKKLKCRQKDAVSSVIGLNRRIDQLYSVFRYKRQVPITIINAEHSTAVLTVHCNDSNPIPIPPYPQLLMENALSNSAFRGIVVGVRQNGVMDKLGNRFTIFVDETGHCLSFSPFIPGASLVGLVEVSIPQSYKTALLSKYFDTERGAINNGTKQKSEIQNKKPTKSNTTKCRNENNNDTRGKISAKSKSPRKRQTISRTGK